MGARTIIKTVELPSDRTVTLRLTICPAEPDVGIFSDYIEDWELFDPSPRSMSPEHLAALYSEINDILSDIEL